ncbi:hypothetical protein TNCV_3471001 [Trichonephila clavipes]|nr:hypothetical protein TNCV_3471001 [Trichonephila clavipes]
MYFNHSTQGYYLDGSKHTLSQPAELIRGNEIYVRLRPVNFTTTKEGSDNETATGTSFTYQELYPIVRSEKNLIWHIPLTHQWYAEAFMGSMLEIKIGAR